MSTVFRAFSLSMKDSFKHVQGNARVALFTQPLWSVVGNLFQPYMTLYMLAVGCTNQQVGQISAVGMVAGTVIAIFAGWLTDRMGRRMTNAVGDFMCWALSCLIWGLSKNVMWFYAAALANSFQRLTGVAWNCLLSEGTEPQHRVNIFWWFSIVQTLTTFVTPAMTLLINPLGLETAMRWVLLSSAGILVVAIFLRNRFMRELPVAIERREKAKKESPFAAIKAYGPMLKLIFTNKLLLVYMLIRMLYYVQAGLRSTFQPITVVSGLGFPKTIIGTLNFVTGGVMLLTQLFMLSRLRTLSADRALVFSIITLAASMLLLVFSPALSLPLLILSTVLSAGGTVVTGMLVDTSMANTLPDQERAQLLSFMTILMVAVSAPFMWLGGVLSGLPGMGPRLPLALITVLFLVCLGLLAAAVKIKKKQPMQTEDQPA